LILAGPDKEITYIAAAGAAGTAALSVGRGIVEVN